MPRANLLEQILEISQDYLGPAAERFIYRQVTTHLNKEPERITKKDLSNLLDWLKLSFGVLTDDTTLVDEYIMRLKRLTATKVSK